MSKNIILRSNGNIILLYDLLVPPLSYGLTLWLLLGMLVHLIEFCFGTKMGALV